MPTAPMMDLPLERISTPPGTGIRRPPASAFTAEMNAGCTEARCARARLPIPIPSAPQALAWAISGRSKLAPSSRLKDTKQPLPSRTATVSGGHLRLLPWLRALSTMMVARARSIMGGAFALGTFGGFAQFIETRGRRVVRPQKLHHRFTMDRILRDHLQRHKNGSGENHPGD